MYIKMNLTKGCALNCKFCHNVMERGKWPTDLNEEELDVIIDRIKENNNVTGMTLLGGEPTDSKLFFKVCQRLSDANFKFGFITAGYNLHLEKFKEVLHNKNLGFIGVSIDSLKSEIVKDIRGKDILDTQKNNLKLIIEEKKKNNLEYVVSTNTILMTENQYDMVDIINYFYRLGVNKVQILEYNPRNGRKTNLQQQFADELKSLDILMQHYRENETEWKKSNFKVEYCFLPPIGKDYVQKKWKIDLKETGNSHICPIYRDTIFISNNGGVYPCEKYKPYLSLDEENPEKVFGIQNLLDYSLDTIVHNDFFSYSDKKREEGDKLFGNCIPCKLCPHLCKDCYPCMLYGIYEQEEIEFAKCSFYSSELKKLDHKI